MSRFLRLALRVSRHSTHPRHQLGAVVVRGGKVLSQACNLHRWGRCAEVRALRPHLDLRGSTLYVARSNGRMSRPCARCMEAIRASGVGAIVYLGWDRNVREERV